MKLQYQTCCDGYPDGLDLGNNPKESWRLIQKSIFSSLRSKGGAGGSPWQWEQWWYFLFEAISNRKNGR